MVGRGPANLGTRCFLVILRCSAKVEPLSLEAGPAEPFPDSLHGYLLGSARALEGIFRDISCSARGIGNSQQRIAYQARTRHKTNLVLCQNPQNEDTSLQVRKKKKKST